MMIVLLLRKWEIGMAVYWHINIKVTDIIVNFAFTIEISGGRQNGE